MRVACKLRIRFEECFGLANAECPLNVLDRLVDDADKTLVNNGYNTDTYIVP